MKGSPSLIALAAFAGAVALPESSLGGAWTQPRGRTWSRVGYMFQSTEERYFLDGRRIPYFFEGHNRTMGFFFDVEHGLRDRLELDLHLPFFRIAFDDLADDRLSTGLGDIRAGVRYNLTKGPWVTTVGTRIKFPTGEFVNDAETVPVGEGQYDVDVSGEVGRSLWPRPGYVTGLVGWRFRTKNEENGIDYGDEIFWSVEAGYNLTPRVMIKGVFRGLHGLETRSFGLPLESLRREILYAEPGVVFQFNEARGIELSVPFTLRGKNWPAGPVLNVGFYQSF